MDRDLLPSHLGQFILRAFGRAWFVADLMGRILLSDPRKRVYLALDIPQVESDEQRTRRLASLKEEQL